MANPNGKVDPVEILTLALATVVCVSCMVIIVYALFNLRHLVIMTVNQGIELSVVK